MQTHHLDVRGESLLVREAGRRGRPSVFFFHSLGLSSELWAEQFRLLQDRCHLLAMDCRGHGQSSNRGGFSVRDCAEDAQAVLGALSIGQVHLVGISMGGLMAAELAARMNGRGASACRSLVLACSYRTLKGPGADERIQRTGETLEEMGMADFGEQYMRETAMSGVTPAVRRRMAALIAGMAPADYLQTLHGILNHDAGPALAELSAVPALLLHGRFDHRVTEPARQALAQAAPYARVRQLGEAGHLANLDDPPAFAQALLDFWSEIPPAENVGDS